MGTSLQDDRWTGKACRQGHKCERLTGERHTGRHLCRAWCIGGAYHGGKLRFLRPSFLPRSCRWGVCSAIAGVPRLPLRLFGTRRCGDIAECEELWGAIDDVNVMLALVQNAAARRSSCTSVEYMLFHKSRTRRSTRRLQSTKRTSFRYIGERRSQGTKEGP